jgi:hypothetical protein
MADLTLSQENDTVVTQVPKGSLWKISSDSTEEMQSISFGKAEKPSVFFTSHPHRSTAELKSVPSPKWQPDWILGILLTCFIILAWVQFFYPKRLAQILVAPYSKRNLNLLVREGKLLTERISVGLGVIYCLLFPLMAYLFYDLSEQQKYGNFLSGFSVYMILVAGILLFWVIKILLIKFLGIIFRTQETTSEYLLNTMIFNFLIGLVLLPFLVFVVYLKSLFFLQVCFGVTVLLLLFSFFRGFMTGILLRKFSYLYLFVYLCSLEILPLIVLMKLFRLYF